MSLISQLQALPQWVPNKGMYPDSIAWVRLSDVLALLAAQPERMKEDEELVSHPFNSRTPYEPGDDRDIWCKDCEYHRDHQIHQPVAAQPEPTQELREAATLVANSLDDVAAIGWGKTVDERLWARECSTALREALKVSAPTPSAWQPIKTAPKNGTKILVLYSFRQHYGVAHWYAGGWWDNGEEYSFDASDWMPLPPPPADADKEP